MANTVPSQITMAESVSVRLPPKRTLSLVALLWLYMVIPATVVVAVVDGLILDSQIRASLRTLPENYVLLAAIFGTPHIVASNLLLVSNRDYLSYYWRRLVLISVGVGVASLLASLFFPRWLILVLLVGWTVHHVLKQQLGIGNIVSRLDGPLFTAWSWLGITTGTVFYSAILLGAEGSQLDLVRQIVVVGSLGVPILAVPLFLRTQGLGRRWFLANSAMMMASGLMFVAGYPLFAVLIPRLAHDATAYAFYLNHDANRLSAGKVGFLHRILGRLRPALGHWPATLMLPLASLLVAAVLENYADRWVNGLSDSLLGFTSVNPVSFGFVGFLALLHYSFESFTWKGASPYRAFVSVSTGN